MLKKEGKLEKALSFVITGLILAALVLFGGVTAVNLYIHSPNNSTPVLGDLIHFIAEVDVENAEFIPVQNLTLEINSTHYCTFSPDGTTMEDGPYDTCEQLTFEPIGDSSSSWSDATSQLWGYGYGYASDTGIYNTTNTTFFNDQAYGYSSVTGYGYTGGESNYSELAYNVTWNITSENYGPGTYNLYLYAEAQTEDSILYKYKSKNALTIIVPSFDFYLTGHTYDVNGTALNNTNVSVIIKDSSTWAQISHETTSTNASGWFNLSLTGRSNYMYEISLEHANETLGNVDWVGQSLPTFPYSEVYNLGIVNYYLKPAGTILIYAVNGTGDSVEFSHQIKDSKLGYPIVESWSGDDTGVTAYVPRDRNYSVMIYPLNSMPISFDWNNFSSTDSYRFGQNLSSYNATTYTVNKTFNISQSYVWVHGYLNQSDDGVSTWSNLTVVPYILEPGNMIFEKEASMPYNMSAWRSGTAKSDTYDASEGFYNITLPGTAEDLNILLVAVADSDGGKYLGFRNVSLEYGSEGTEINFTHVYAALGNTSSNMSQRRATDWETRWNTTTNKQRFLLVNSSNNETLTNIDAHVEVVLDYSNYGANEFTFMTEARAENGDQGQFVIPMINATGFKELNVYTMNGAPRNIKSKTPAQITADNKIPISSFNPGEIPGEEAIAAGNIVINLYKSNSSCDIPVPGADCDLVDSSDMSSFNPLTAIIGGGAISFRMGVGGILVHYVNVDMLASGPPDAMFEDYGDGLNSSGTSAFDAAVRFGSNGPSIYDYVLISMPYTETAGTGLDDSQPVYLQVKTLYDDDWNVIWNITTNGTSGTNLAGNYSHYETYSDDWETLMGNNTCTTGTVTSSAQINASNPCHIDTTNNRIWVRLPHFSGTGPSAAGTIKSSGSSSPGGGGGGGGGSDENETIEEPSEVELPSEEPGDVVPEESEELTEEEAAAKKRTFITTILILVLVAAIVVVIAVVIPKKKKK